MYIYIKHIIFRWYVKIIFFYKKWIPICYKSRPREWNKYYFKTKLNLKQLSVVLLAECSTRTQFRKYEHGIKIKKSNTNRNVK